MHEYISTQTLSEPDSLSASANTTHFDAVIIGAGLGGLLSAAQLLLRDKRVLILERLPHSGGRFTAKTFQGVQVSTGAVHMVPFGSTGVLSQMLQRLRVPHHLFDADVFGSFHVRGRQYRVPGLLALVRVLGPRQFGQLVRIGYHMFVRPLSRQEQALPFDLWLARYIDVERNPRLVAFFASISRFALSLELRQVSTAEVVRTTKNMLKYGAPAIVQGGCGELTTQLEGHVIAHGGEIRHSCEVLQILSQDEKATGVRVRDKATGEEKVIHAPLVVSDIGPRATDALLHSRRVTQTEVLKSQQASATAQNDAMSTTPEVTVQEAVGLKIHILSDVSLIPHKGIMYCLDTRRIAGMVQPTNSDPSLAPAGKHLLISHQVIQSNNVEEERALALADLKMMFGADTFARQCKVLTMGTYRGEWPVNRIAQGADVEPKLALHGLYLVGDAVKPSGYLMVEGVAQSVNRFLDLLEDLDQQGHGQQGRRFKSNIAYPASRFNVIRWLWQAPGNSGKV